MTKLIRIDDSDVAPVEGFGIALPLVPPRPDTALTALVTGMALAVCIAVTVTALSFGRAQSEHAVANGNIVAAQPMYSSVARI